MSIRKNKSTASADIDQRMFSCNTCDAKFWIKSKLDKHILSHAETVFSCNTCNESFSSYSDLDLHSRLHKRNDKANYCLDCKAQFADRSELLYHVHITHPGHSMPKNQSPRTVAKTNALPKIVQVGALSGNKKIENPIIFGKVVCAKLSPKIEPILKTSKPANVQKVNKSLSWKDGMKISPKQPPKRVSGFPQSPRKQQKVIRLSDVKRGALGYSPGMVHSSPVKQFKGSPSFGETSKKTSVTPTVIRVGEINLSSVKVGSGTPPKQLVNSAKTLVHNQTSPKQLINPVKTLVHNQTSHEQPVTPSKSLVHIQQIHQTLPKQINTTVKALIHNQPIHQTSPKQLVTPVKTLVHNQPIPSESLTVVRVSSVPEKPIATSSQDISLSPAKIVINLPPQGGLVQPGQQLVSANHFVGKTFIIQKNLNSGDQVGSPAQFVKQRVLVKPVPSPKPPVQRVVPASPDKQLPPVQRVVPASPDKQLPPVQRVASSDKQLPPPQRKSLLLPASIRSQLSAEAISVDSETSKRNQETKQTKESQSTQPRFAADAISVNPETPKRNQKKRQVPQAEEPKRILLQPTTNIIPETTKRNQESKQVKVLGSIGSQPAVSSEGPKQNQEAKELDQIKTESPEKTPLVVVPLPQTRSIGVSTPRGTGTKNQSLSSGKNESSAKANLSPKQMNTIDLTSFEVGLPVVSLTKLPNSIYEECTRIGFASMKNVHMKSLAESKKRKQMRPKITPSVSKDDLTQNVRASRSKVAHTPRKTRSLAVRDSDVDVCNANTKVEKPKSLQNVGTVAFQDPVVEDSQRSSSNTENVTSPTRKTRNMRNRDFSRQHSGNVKSVGLSASNLSSPTKESLKVATPISGDAKVRRQISTETKTPVSPTKRYPRRGKNAEKANQGLAKSRAQNVKSNALAGSISNAVSSSKTNELNFVNGRIATPVSVGNQTPSNVKVVPVSADFMRKLKESLLKNTPGSNPNNIKLVVPSEILSKIQAPATQTVLSTKTVPERSPAIVPVAQPSKESLLKSSCSDPNNIQVVVPSEIICKIQAPATQTVLSTKTVPESSPVPKRFVKPLRSGVKKIENVEEMLRAEKEKKEEKEWIKKKEKILKKMLVKYEEKEERKQAKYFQKKLARFIEKNRKHLLGSEKRLFEVISNSAKILEELKSLKHATETEIMNQLVTNVMLKSLINSEDDTEEEMIKEKQKKSVQGFVNVSRNRTGKKCAAISVPPEKKSIAPKTRNVPLKRSPKPKKFSMLTDDSVYVYKAENETSLEDKGDQVSYSKYTNNSRKVLYHSPGSQKQTIKSFQEDPFTDMSIITGETFTIQCPCQKENCDGLHPELTFI